MNLFIVTGTSKGLGRALADQLSASAENVVFEIGRQSQTGNRQPTLIAADFANTASIEQAFAVLAENLAGKNFVFAALINNAGVVLPVGRFNTLEAAALEKNFTVNVTAPILTTKLFANLTRAIAGKRLVVGISSGAAKRAVRGWTAYCAAKCALEMATRVMAEEARELDPTLAICSLAPGIFDTAMQATIRNASAEDFPDVARFRDMKESGALRDVAAVARDIILLLDPPAGQEQLLNGGNYDIRELNHA